MARVALIDTLDATADIPVILLIAKVVSTFGTGFAMDVVWTGTGTVETMESAPVAFSGREIEG